VLETGEVKIPYGKHVGARGYHQGSLRVWKVKTDLSNPSLTAADGGSNRVAWCSVAPLNRRLRLYAYEFNVCTNANKILFAYDLGTVKRCPEDDIKLGPTPIHFDRLQGGVFTRRGRLIISRSGPNGVFCFSAISGWCFGGKQLGDFGSAYSELEGVTVRPWQFNGVSANVHLLELDNDAGNKDDCYVHSFNVPDPGRL